MQENYLGKAPILWLWAAWCLALLPAVCGVRPVAAQGWQKPELVLQSGHSTWVSSVAVSPDGRALASSDESGKITLWDAATHHELRAFVKPAGKTVIAFSRDGRSLLSGEASGLIRQWELASGQELRQFTGHSSFVTDLAVSPDGKLLASASWDKTARVWELNSGREIHKLTGHTDVVGAVAFSADGRTLASGGWDKSIKIWDVASGQLRHTLRGHEERLADLAFSPTDNNFLASAGWDATIRFWQCATGTESGVWRGHADKVKALAFSPDGKSLASGGDDEAIRVWSVPDVSLIVEIPTGNWVTALVYESGGATLMSGGLRQVTGWAVPSGVPSYRLTGQTQTVAALAFAPRHKILAATQHLNLKLWDLGADKSVQTLGPHELTIQGLAFSPDEKLLASADAAGVVKVWDWSNERQSGSYANGESVYALAFSPDSLTLAGGDADGQLFLWDVATQRVRRKWAAHTSLLTALAYSPDGKWLASGGAGQIVKLWDARTGQAAGNGAQYKGGVTSLVFSPQSDKLASGSDDGTVEVWAVRARRALYKLPLANNAFVNHVTFSGDGKTLAVSRSDAGITFYAADTGQKLRSLTGHGAAVLTGQFILNDQFFASGSVDNTLKIWRSATGQELLTLAAMNDNDWLVSTPDGLFDGTPAAWQQTLWRFNEDSFSSTPLETYFADFYQPGLLPQIIDGQRLSAPRDLAALDRRPPQVTLRRADAADAPATRRLAVQIEVTEAPEDSANRLETGEARDVRLFRNGSLVKVWRGANIAELVKAGCVEVDAPTETQRQVRCQTQVALVAGANRLTAYAFNRDNVKSQDALLVVKGADNLARQGVAYLLNIGVNQYANPEFNLKYAVPDAIAFGAEVKARQEQLQNYERVELIPLLDKSANKANILRVLRDLQSRVQPEDAVIIYFAGHGIAEGQQFYLIPHDLGYRGRRDDLDEAGLQQILAQSISDRELEQVLAALGV